MREIEKQLKKNFFEIEYNNFGSYIADLRLFVENITKQNFNFNKLNYNEQFSKETILFNVVRKHLKFWSRNNTKFLYQMLMLLNAGANPQVASLTQGRNTIAKLIEKSTATPLAIQIAKIILSDYQKLKNMPIFENCQDLLNYILTFNNRKNSLLLNDDNYNLKLLAKVAVDKEKDDLTFKIAINKLADAHPANVSNTSTKLWRPF